MTSMSEVENKKRRLEERVEDVEQSQEELRIAGGYEEGNITLVGDDNVGFKVWDYCLRARSVVFRSMLDSCVTEGRIIRIPDTSEQPLACFVDAFLDNHTRRHAETITEALELCDKYDCPAVARAILSKALDGNLSAATFDFRKAFALACKLRDAGSGSQILALQRKYEGRNWNEHRRRTISRVKLWTLQDAEQISVGWFFALTKASEKVGEADPNYWVILAAHFADELR